MYAQITSVELSKLATLKASGLQTQVYLALASHAWGRETCFPSLKTIKKALANVPHINSISRALKWLEDVGLIARQEATSKSRFRLILRKVKEAVKKCSNEMVNAIIPPRIYKRKPKRRNTSYSKQRDKNKVHQNKLKIISWVEAMGEVKDLQDMRKDEQYSTILASMNLTDESYQFPPKPQGTWLIEDVKQAFRDYGYGLADNHWIFQHYMSLYGASTPQSM
jgi:hypothetical protein